MKYTQLASLMLGHQIVDVEVDGFTRVYLDNGQVVKIFGKGWSDRLEVVSIGSLPQAQEKVGFLDRILGRFGYTRAKKGGKT